MKLFSKNKNKFFGKLIDSKSFFISTTNKNIFLPKLKSNDNKSREISTMLQRSNKSNKIEKIKLKKREYSTEQEFGNLGLSDLFKSQEASQMQFFGFVMDCYNKKIPVQLSREDLRAQDPKNPSSAVAGMIVDMTESLILVNGEEGFKIVRSHDITSVIYDTKEMKKNYPAFLVPPLVGLQLENWDSVINYFSSNNNVLKNIKIKRQDVSIKEYRVSNLQIVDKLVHCHIVHQDNVVDGILVFPPEEMSEISFVI